jgi:hypothetical protein
MKIKERVIDELPEQYVLIVDVGEDAAIYLNQDYLAGLYDDDHSSAWSIVETIATNLSLTLNIPLIRFEVELEDDEWEDWKITEVVEFAIEELT